MSGKIKKGLGTLIGNAGEYYVMAELLKRDVIAALAPRNAPGFDILATKGSRIINLTYQRVLYDIVIMDVIHYIRISHLNNGHKRGLP